MSAITRDWIAPNHQYVFCTKQSNPPSWVFKGIDFFSGRFRIIGSNDELAIVKVSLAFSKPPLKAIAIRFEFEVNEIKTAYGKGYQLLQVNSSFSLNITPVHPTTYMVITQKGVSGIILVRQPKNIFIETANVL